MTLSLAGTRRDAGVSIAEVNLKLIWDVVSKIKVGQHGQAYVVDKQGRLIAHPDISLVLRKTDMTRLAQVQAARQLQAGAAPPDIETAADIQGRQVLTAFAPVAPLGWTVFVELPVDEAYQPLIASLQRTALVLFGALCLAALAGMFLARRMVVPIQALRAGAARIGGGDLSQRISIKSGDELEALADQFNDMAGRLQESYAGLEQKVEARTRELTASLEQQTATSEVLKVISSSPGVLDPVFQALLANATRICGAKFGTLYLSDGDAFQGTAFHNAPPAFVEERKRGPIRPHPESTLGRAARTKQVAQVLDSMKHDAYLQRDPFVVAGAELGGYRTILSIPMLKEDKLVGVISIYRQEVQAFTDKQIALLTSFAAQAVIAIENTRLLSELRESLEQQTATSEVLKVISSSPGEIGPVFEAILDNATRICEAKFGMLYSYDGEQFHNAAMRNAPEALLELHRQRGPFQPPPGTSLDRLLKTLNVVRSADESAQEAPSAPARLAGGKSHLAVPMFKDESLVGAIVIYRQEVRPFTDKQVELVQNFAAQAVIAIENTRLLKELHQRTDDLTESLEQQTATSEVLKVISSSPGELRPVFDAMLDNAVRICGANFGTLYLAEGNKYRVAALHNAPPEFAEFQSRRGWFQPTPGAMLERAMLTKQVCHSADAAAEAVVGNSAKVGGGRSTIYVPMVKDDELVGTIVIYRREVRPFTDKQIELVQNFAAQAVIAIENTRLLNELRQRTDDLTESLEQQTATSQVLQVISTSPGDLQPVFEAMLDNATRICRADSGTDLSLRWRQIPHRGDVRRKSRTHGIPQATRAV